jgi:hypothetical protein
MKEFCGEIIYTNADGDNVQSDICKHNTDEVTEGYRAFLHANLDEWLNKANGEGAFWVGDPEYFRSWEKE